MTMRYHMLPDIPFQEHTERDSTRAGMSEKLKASPLEVHSEWQKHWTTTMTKNTSLTFVSTCAAVQLPRPAERPRRINRTCMVLVKVKSQKMLHSVTGFTVFSATLGAQKQFRILQDEWTAPVGRRTTRMRAADCSHRKSDHMQGRGKSSCITFVVSSFT